MRALLLAAGRATRLGKLSETTPKCLQDVGGAALLDRLVEQVLSAGVDEILINTHHLSSQIESHVNNASWRHLVTVVHEPELLGTLGTLRANAAYFKGDPALVLHADNYIVGSLAPLVRAFDSRPPSVNAAMLTFETSEPSSCGVVELGPGNLITAFYEKVKNPPTRVASAATFVFGNSVITELQYLPFSAADISRDLIPRLLGSIIAVPCEGDVVDIGTPQGLQIARDIAGLS